MVPEASSFPSGISTASPLPNAPRLGAKLAYTAKLGAGIRDESALDFLEFDRMPAHRCERQQDMPGWHGLGLG